MNEVIMLPKGTRRNQIDWLYGGEEYYITKDQIEELINGSIIYLPVNDEYGVIIKFKKENKQWK